MFYQAGFENFFTSPSVVQIGSKKPFRQPPLKSIWSKVLEAAENRKTVDIQKVIKVSKLTGAPKSRFSDKSQGNRQMT